MKERRRGGAVVRGGVGRSRLARLSPSARYDYLRSLAPPERRAVIEASRRGASRSPQKPRATAMHEVRVRGIVAECATDGCGWQGTADEAVSHMFGG